MRGDVRRYLILRKPEMPICFIRLLRAHGLGWVCNFKSYCKVWRKTIVGVYQHG